jgi:hypothetical protein
MMSMARPDARIENVGNSDEAEASFDGALLNQTASLSSVIAESRINGSGRVLGDAELMRIVRSQQTLLSAGAERGADQIAEQAGTMPLRPDSPSRWQASKRKGRLAIALGAAIGGAAALYGVIARK